MYSTLHCLTLRGWLDHQWQVLRIAQHFWGAWDELSIKAGLLIKGSCIYIPPELLDHTLSGLYRAQKGMEKMQAHAIEAAYWPGIDADIADYVHQCTICTKHKASLPAQMMLPRDIPDGPWKEITANYFTHKGKEYLLICILFSKYSFLSKITSKSAYSLSQCLQELISHYRLPSLIYTDNAPFVSSEFTQFLQHHYIDHVTPFPHFP